MFRRALLSAVALAVCVGAWGQAEDLDAVKAQIAERLTRLETFSADTTTMMNMGALTIVVRGATRGKGALQETTSVFDIFGQKMQFRSVTDVQGVRWHEADIMGAKEVTKTAKSAKSADAHAVEFGFGTMIGAESVDPRTVLDDLAAHYDLAALGRETIDGTELFVVGGDLNADEAAELQEELGDTDALGFAGGFVEGMAKSFMKVKVYIGVADGFPRKVAMLSDADKPTLTQTFTNLKLNESIDDGAFVYTAPDGVEVRDLDVMTETATVRLRDTAPAFDVLALDGKDVALADYEGKVVLLDFWAIWCAPCVVQLPELTALYEKYHPQGLEVIGVNLDGDRQKVEDFLKERPAVAWKQVFDGNAWDSEVAVLYGVEALPLTVLIGKDGRIIALGLHGEELAQAVAKALAEDDAV